MSLPPSPSVALPINGNPYGINDKGEIVGVAHIGGPKHLASRCYGNHSTAKEQSTPKRLCFLCPRVDSQTARAWALMNSATWSAIVGTTDYSMDLPVRWTTKDPSFSEIINFPGDWGFAWGVNNNRIATVTYWWRRELPTRQVRLMRRCNPAPLNGKTTV